MRATALGKFNAIAVAVALAMGTVCLSQDAQAQAQPADVRQYDIPAGNLADGLKQLSLKGRLQLLAPPELTTGLRGKAVSGTYTPREALEQLLTGTGLSYEFVNSSTVVVKKADKPPSPVQPASSSAAKPNSRASVPAPTELDEVTVTGTRIRGGITPSPVVTIGFERIAEEGFTDLGEVIRSVSQNFSGGQNPGVISGNIAGAGLANQNITGGSSLNLRGLGPDATLTLLNGRRLSYGGFVQAVDISAIPVEAVERIEIVADGASAIYGSDAVGGVGNVILKRYFDGVTVGARYGGATDGGMTTREYNATAGAVWSSGGLIATWKDVSVDPIYADERDYTNHLPDPSTLFPGSDMRSGLISVHQSLGDYVELSLDALRTEREQTLSYYTSNLTQYIHPTPETTTTIVSTSIEFLLPQDWTLTVGGAWGEDEHNQVQSSVIVATGLSTIMYDDCYCNESRTYEVGAEGPLFALPGGNARLAVGAGYRQNEFSQINYITGATPIQGDESSRFSYAEINLPLIGADSNIPGIQRLALTAAVRGEDYDSFGSVTTPKFGLIYGPSADFTLKASWGKSFKAPTLQQRFLAQAAYLYSARTLGGTGYAGDATALYLYGGDADLDPERARTWSASLAYHPTALPGLDLELTWFDIDYTDRVVQPIASASQALSNAVYAEFVEYSPTTEGQAEVIAAADDFYNFSGAAYDPGRVAAIVYGQYTNVARQQTQGLDLSAAYRFDLGAGRLTIRGSSTWLDSLQQVSVAQGTYDLAGTLFNPAKVNSRIGAVWNQGGFSASAFANYKSGVTNTRDNEKSDSFTTFDATLRYATGERDGALSGLEFVLSAQNLFDREPPLYTPVSAINVAPYDSTNYSAIGRYLSVSVSMHF